MKTSKKVALSLAVMTTGVVSFSSCGLAESEQHGFNVNYPTSGTSYTYADQTKDSLYFVTFDSWTLSYSNDQTWFKTTEATYNKVPNGYIDYRVIHFDLEPNTTGNFRNALVTINSNNNIFQVSYVQSQLLHVINPSLSIDYSDHSKDSINAQVLRNLRVDSCIVFEAHGDWSVSSSDPCLTFKNETTGTSGTKKLYYTIEANTGAMRTVSINLTSNGVTNEIKIRQDAK